MHHLVIVESPTKAKTIHKYLGSDYTVIASMGHVRDLPRSSSDIPEELKKTDWAQLGVNVDKDFEPLYLISKDKTKVITQLKKALKDAEDVYLATDEDREGESISWHLLQVLKPKVPVHRMVFHEITKQAIEKALAHPREIDEKLVRAQEARRILDRLVGYSISPVLWKKIAYGLSAGRVQSATLKAIVDRERKRMAFVRAGYWDVGANLNHAKGDFESKLISTSGKRIASSKDFDEETGALKEEAKNIVLLDETQSKKIAQEMPGLSWKVTEVNKKPVTRRPPAPFITSTLQQEANRKLGLSSKEAMRAAQALYEKGHITYMRTDSVTLSADAIAAARRNIESRFGKEFLPDEARHYTSQAKGAQEAHEAIRPSLLFTAPHDLDVSPAERGLYELIWMRTLASQMRDSDQLQLSIVTQAGDHVSSSSGLKILFPGFLRAYVEGAEDTEQALSDKEHILPELSVGDSVACQTAEAQSHETKPPSRFTEAGLIQFMEKEGIGRPSTYASTISTLNDRGYVRKMSGALVPSFTAFAVTQLMERHFPDLVDTKFTSKMEESLDNIADGKQEWLPYLRAFFLGDKGLRERIEHEVSTIDPEAAKRIDIPQLPGVIIRVGKFGPYFETEHPKSHTMVKASIPEDAAPADFNQQKVDELAAQAQQGPTTLGKDPESGKEIYLKTGSYGPYLQLGEDSEDKKVKPKRVSIPKNVPLETLSHDKALLILSLPRLLGTHPESTKEIRAGLGRFGPYVVCDGDFRSLKGEDDVLTVTLTRALELLAMPKGAGRGRAAVLRTIGNHPESGKPMTLHQGKFGTYIKHRATNVTLPKELKPEDVTVEKAVELLAAKKEKRKK
ncbi:type I DNA topoisomerase [Candidatus Uhrbacteria bacterium]|nr:type I DNA topoisomerase [Candidatus Uhrbacteria bacterium]